MHDRPDESSADTRPASLPPVSRPLTFAPEQLVADRFRIVRFVASGGMGEVYEAEDLELHERVALKTIRPEIAQDERAIARFKREAFLARQVTHPNICRIFDLFVHRPSASPGITFVSMQLLEGPTLAERLRREPMTAAEALPLVVQMAGALDAAHQVGVVHRDFKSNNVMLLPQLSGPRAVITDFGLAWRAGEDRHARHTPPTGPGEILGTPDYMAPEQVEGGEVTPSTDVYALGLVMYEMVTGVRPFAAATPLAAAVRRLSEAPKPPRELAPDLDPVWESVIMRCLERQPEDRFQRAGEIVAALGGAAQAASPPRHSALLPVAGALLLAAMFVALAAALAWRSRAPAADPDPAVQSARSAPRRSVAVLGFRNASGRPDAAWLSTAFAEMLTTELAAGEQLRTIPGENIARMKMELALADADTYAADTLGRIRDSLGTDLVVLGSYVTVGQPGAGTIRLDARLQDSREGGTIAQVSETSAEGDVLELVTRTGRRLRERLNIEALPAAATAEVLASQPANLEAARLYAEGLERLRQFDALAARDLLERAIAADARFPLSHAALAMAWATLGYDERARASAGKAFELSSSLSREERLSVEGAYRETAREWKQAIDIYQTLFRFFPDNLEYGLRLANAQVVSGAPKDALATIDTLRAAAAGAPADPRIDLADAAASETLSDFKRMLAASAAAGSHGASQGSRLLVARAKLLEGTATLRAGNAERAIALYEEARATFAQGGDRGGLARSLTALGNVLIDHGDIERAVTIYQQALTIARAIGHQRTVSQALSNLAIARRRAGDLDGSLTFNREALAIRREIGDRVNEAVSLNNIGNVLLDRGDLAGATRHYDEAAEIHRAIGDRRGLARARNNAAVALKMLGQLAPALAANQEALTIRRDIADSMGVSISLYNLGEVLALQGDLPGAVKYLDEALALQRKLEIARGMAFSLHVLGDIALAQGDTALARTRVQEAIDIRTKLGEKGTVAESQIELALVALAAGSPAEGERLARGAVDFFTGQNADTEALARATLARSLLAAGQSAGALSEAGRARDLVRNTQNTIVKLTVGIGAARTQGLAQPASAAAAMASLAAAEGQARTMGLIHLQFDAALAQAEIAVRSKPADGHARLATIEKDARARGLGLVAARAGRGQPTTKR